MKKATFLLILVTSSFHAQHTQNQWIWVGGSKNAEENTWEYGAISHENEVNFPAFTQSDNSVTDSNGNIWFFSGDDYYGYNTQLRSSSLWTYNPMTNNFTFRKGVFRGFSFGGNKGVGVEHYRNIARTAANRQIWIDNENNLWCYSGQNVNDLNKSELWKFRIETNNWILIDEGNVDFSGNFGVMGLESSTNKPPILENAITWTDNDNNLWMFGGNLLSSVDQLSNALWKYNIDTGYWTWMSGSNLSNQTSSYGPLGIESPDSMPGSTENGRTGWVDAEGYLWFLDSDFNSIVNNIWKYNTVTNLWTLVKQSLDENIVTVGTAHIDNFPKLYSGDTRKWKNFWKDLDGNIWYFYNTENTDKLWKYSPTTNLWTLVKQIPNSTFSGQAIGGFNDSNINNTVGPRHNCITGVGLNGKLYLMGGYYYHNGNILKDVWEYDISTNIWKWVNGYQTEELAMESGQRIKFDGLIESENSPGLMQGYVAKWEHEGDLYLYGIYGVINGNQPHLYSGILDGTGGGTAYSKTLWKYHSFLKKWQILHSFDERNIAYFRWNPIYNSKGVENEFNYPSIRKHSSAMSFADNEGNLYMFGGNKVQGVSQYLNDLWKFNMNTKSWVWIGGNNSVNQHGIYGTQGVFDDMNIPGAREKGIVWTDNQGGIWLFGGFGYDGVSSYGGLNDMWKYDIDLNQWAWIKGPNLAGQNEVSAGLGVSDINNIPPSALNYANWVDNSNNLWLFCGSLWKFDTSDNNWTKVADNKPLNYGVLGVPAPTNSPSSISEKMFWTDLNGNLIYFNSVLWRFDVNTLMWTRLGGRIPGGPFANLWRLGNYGQFNQSFVSNLPGYRNSAVAWKDNNSNFFLYGGNGWDEDSQGRLSDVWMMNRRFNTISGNIRYDDNNDGCDNSNFFMENVKINIIDGSTNSFIFTNNFGNYTILAQNNNVSIYPELDYFSFTPNSQEFYFNVFETSEFQDFCAVTTGLYNDLEIVIIPITDAIPGFNSKYKLLYRNKGTTILSGNIDFEFNNAVMEFVSSDIFPVSQSNDTISWDFNDLLPLEYRAIELVFNLNSPTDIPSLNSDDILSFYSTINSSSIDETPSDNSFNLNQMVINSYDPNDKLCLNGSEITPDKIGEFVYYKIRFENTGTAVANHILITDYIDLSKFDIETIMPVEASHNYTMSVTENKVEFLFEYINLPFPPSSLVHGYIVFKIKTKSNLVAGDMFSNSANIYFDYNFPIITNNYITTIQNNLGIVEDDFKNNIVVYPNPVKDLLYFHTSEKVSKVIVYDVFGRVIRSSAIIDNTMNLAELKTGSYVLKVFTIDGIKNTKILKE